MSIWAERLRLKYLGYVLLTYVALAGVFNAFWGYTVFDFEAAIRQGNEQAGSLNWWPPYFETYPRVLYLIIMPALVTWGLFVLAQEKRVASAVVIALFIPFCFPALSALMDVATSDASWRSFDWEGLGWLYVILFIPCLILGGINAILVRFLPEAKHEA